MSDAAFRMIDANLNRAREAIRTIEDVARFAWNDHAIASAAKELRHGLQSATAAISPSRLALSRDVDGDVGTTTVGANEYRRDDLGAVAIAAGKRLTEALRVIEEASKSLDPSAGAPAARDIESIRYAAYALDARVTVRASCAQPRQWRLCVLVTRALCRQPWERVVEAAIAGGADAIQIREKELDARELVAHARAARAICAPRGVALIVNDRLDAALAAGADGVHLGVDDLPVRDARRIAGASLFIGASTHSLDEARAAIDAGADHCGVGAMYESSLKPGLAPTGEAYLRAFVAEFPQVPHLAIGGIAPGRIAALARAGCRGVAVSSAVCAADDPASVARAIIAELAP
ncbi:MAG: thiamine-phosphate pyrophosphorylase [Planctomycetota bacterium]|jgi:thiamine-phosphate pyrophosphorylase